MAYSKINYAGLPTQQYNYDWIANAMKNILEGYKMAGEPDRIDRADKRDKVDTQYYEPTKQEELLSSILGNKKNQELLQYVGPQAQAQLANLLANTDSTKASTDLEKAKLPYVGQQTLADIAYKNTMAEHLKQGSQAKQNQYESALKSYQDAVKNNGPDSQEAKLSGAYLNRVSYGVGNTPGGQSGAASSSSYTTPTKVAVNRIQNQIDANNQAIDALENAADLSLSVGGGGTYSLPAQEFLNKHAGTSFDDANRLANARAHGNKAIEHYITGSGLPKTNEAQHTVHDILFPHKGETPEGYTKRRMAIIEDLKKRNAVLGGYLQTGIPISSSKKMPEDKKRELINAAQSAIAANAAEGQRSNPALDQLMNSKEDLSKSKDPRIRALAEHFNKTATKLAKITDSDVMHTAQKYNMTPQEVIAKLKAEGRI